MRFLFYYKKTLLRVAILGCLLGVGIILLRRTAAISSIYEEQQKQLELENIQTNMANEGSGVQTEPDISQIFTITVSPLGDTSIKNGAEMAINWWYNEEDGKYYIFLPASANPDSLKINMSIVNEIFVDGKRIKNGDTCALPLGSHEITTSYDEQIFQLEVMQSANVATLFFDTNSGSLQYLHTDKANEEGGKVTILRANGKTEFAGDMEAIHCRGNASWTDTDKKSYQLKLLSETSLFGMGAAKKWLLIANAFDNTLIRNVTALSMAQELGLAYTPQSEYVDVYANGNYVGNYLLMEKIEIGENRIRINNLEKETEKMNKYIEDLSTCDTFMEPQGRLYSTKGYQIPREPVDLSGGYLLEIEMSDRYGLEASGFMTSRMQPVVFSSPKYASHAQVSYIANRYQDFEDAIYSEDGYSPYTGTYFGDYIDMDSFARKYLLEEMVKNLDAAFTSQFIYKPNDKESTKFFAGPAWDYDKAIAGSGITQEGIDLFDPVGFYACVQTKDSDYWYGLYQQEEFRNRAIGIYFDEYKTITEKEATEKIQERADYILQADMMNAYRWNTFNEDATIEEKTDTFYEKVEELKNFLHKRNEFLTSEWES